jgi:hypothetical protein
MRIKFITDVELEVFKNVIASTESLATESSKSGAVVFKIVDESTIETLTTKSFKSGTEIDINVFNRRKVNDIDIRFGDGSVAYRVNTEWFEVL